MTYNYAPIAATALKLLSRFGSTVTLSRKTGDSTDPVTGAVTAGTDASVATTGVLVPYPDNMIDGTRILKSDRNLILSNEEEPSPTDKPVIAGELWAIKAIETVKPNGVDAVVYKVQVSR